MNNNALLAAEVNHRIRNFFATVEAVVRQTDADSIEQYRAKLMSRLQRVRGFYEVLGVSCGEPVDLAQLLERTVGTSNITGGASVVTKGAAVVLEPKLALALHLVFHELTMNACKYGALSVPTGTVTIGWREADRKLAIVWAESGGPKPQAERARGFGSRLINQALRAYGDVDLAFTPAGAVCRIIIEHGVAPSPTRRETEPV